MKKRFRDVVDLIDYDDLLKMKKDIEKGGTHISRLVDDKIKEEQKKHHRVCSVCTNDISDHSVSTYTLVFGPDDFKKKATFCGIDCLEYFISGMKKRVEGVRNELREK